MNQKIAYVNKTNIAMDVEPYCCSYDDNMPMFPLKYIAQALGFKVEWFGDNKIFSVIQ